MFVSVSGRSAPWPGQSWPMNLCTFCCVFLFLELWAISQEACCTGCRGGGQAGWAPTARSLTVLERGTHWLSAAKYKDLVHACIFETKPLCISISFLVLFFVLGVFAFFLCSFYAQRSYPLVGSWCVGQLARSVRPYRPSLCVCVTMDLTIRLGRMMVGTHVTD